MTIRFEQVICQIKNLVAKKVRERKLEGEWDFSMMLEIFWHFHARQWEIDDSRYIIVDLNRKGSGEKIVFAFDCFNNLLAIWFHDPADNVSVIFLVDGRPECGSLLDEIRIRKSFCTATGMFVLGKTQGQLELALSRSSISDLMTYWFK